MTWSRCLSALALGLAVITMNLAGLDLQASEPGGTRLLAQPAISSDHVAFIYADDLWIADRNGSNPRRLTSHPGVEAEPAFSPDGQTLAFTGQYDGNVDVYTIPVTGGSPQRLTWHPASDLVCGFSPDGERILFSSARNVFTRRHEQFFTIGLDGGFPTQLEIPHGTDGAISPDGNYLAYTPLSEAFRQWKGYRGGRHSRIWIYRFDDHSVTQVPQPEDRCNDVNPMWIDGILYFLSDRQGEFNLFRYSTDSQKVDQLTNHESFPIEDASVGADQIIYEHSGYLYTYTPSSREEPQPLPIEVAADLLELRPRYVDGVQYVRGASLSPTGKRVALEYRGEIVTVPAKKGDIRNLTETPAAHERSPSWSPDGQTIAYFSDATGEYQLILQDQEGQGEPRTLDLQGGGFYLTPQWSPDGQTIAYRDNAGSLARIDLESGQITILEDQPPGGSGSVSKVSWSPDSQWMAYTISGPSRFDLLKLHSLETGESQTITSGLAQVGEPTFDRQGKYLYFSASTDVGPRRFGFMLSSNDSQFSQSLYMVTLDRQTPSPLLRESDEEEVSEEKGGDVDNEDENENQETGDSEQEAEDEITIDLDGMSSRILPLPVRAGLLSNLQVGDDNKLYYIRRELSRPGSAGLQGGPSTLQRFSLKERKQEDLAKGINGYEISHDGQKLFYAADGPTWGIVDLGKFSPGDGKLAVDRIEVKIDPRAEWQQILREAWRINRDYFYDPDLHGLDWQGIYDKYAEFLPDLAVRSDLNRIIRMMCSELGVGHSYLSGGDRLYDPERISVGLLGADLEVAEGRYRFAKIFGGLNWDPGLRSPLTVPGVNVEEGEFLLAVDGRPLETPANPYEPFEATVGKIVELTVGTNADGTDSRTVEVEPIANESTLRNRAWIEGNLKKVQEATNGRVAYVYLPNTTTAGFNSFKRYFYPQVDKEAVIIDERFNAGGQMPDYYIDSLNRRLVSYWSPRFGDIYKSPGASIQGPKVMIIDETAGSGGDMLPWMFRKFDLGPLVGRPTWGGLIGIGGYPVLMDGGSVTAPRFRIFTEDGWVVENVGVPPDVEVEQWPSEVIAGTDPQLEKAIEIVLEQLEASPPQEVERPPYPILDRQP